MSNTHSPLQLAIICFDNVYLAFPQQYVASVDLIMDLNTEIVAPNSVGYIEQDIYKWPIFAIIKDFSLARQLPQARRYCICFRGENEAQQFGLAVDSVESYLLQNSENIHSLPDSMANPISPLSKFFKLEKNMVFISKTKEMLKFLMNTGDFA